MDDPQLQSRLALLQQRLRQLILMRETAPKRPRWHAARMRLIWHLHEEIAHVQAEIAALEEEQRTKTIDK